MRLSKQQEARLARFAQALKGSPPGGGDPREHLSSARRFELYLMGRGLPFSEGSFRTYLLEMHRAAASPKEERDAEQARLKKYYHSFRAELASDAAAAEPPAEASPAAPSPPPSGLAPAPREPPAKTPPARRASAFEDLPAEEEIVCPKCSFRQPRTDTCARCGIVYEKWKRSPSRGAGDMLQKLEAQLGLRPAARREQGAPGLNFIVFLALGPMVLIFLFALFRNLDRKLRVEIVRAEQEFQGLEKEIAAIDTPPTVAHRCLNFRGGGEKPAPGPFRILVPARIWLSPDRPFAVPLALAPDDPGIARFLEEELTVSLQRSWTDTSISPSGLKEVENIWNQKRVFREEKARPRFAEDIPPLARGEPAWRYELLLEGVPAKPGTYTLEAGISGLFPLPMLGLRSKHSWQRGSYQCEPAAIEVKAPGDTQALRAVLATQRQGKEEGLRALRRHARFTRTAMYLSAVALLALMIYIGYRIFVPLEEETPGR